MPSWSIWRAACLSCVERAGGTAKSSTTVTPVSSFRRRTHGPLRSALSICASIGNSAGRWASPVSEGSNRTFRSSAWSAGTCGSTLRAWADEEPASIGGPRPFRRPKPTAKERPDARESVLCRPRRPHASQPWPGWPRASATIAPGRAASDHGGVCEDSPILTERCFVVRVLMLVPYPTIQGPLPKIVPLLMEALRQLGCDVETECWSRHSDHESLLEKTLGRAGDLGRIRTRLRARRFDVLFITTAHTTAALTRDIPLVLATQRSCPHRVIQFHGSSSAQLSSHGHTVLRWASRLLISHCDAVLVLSEQERREWASFCPAGRFEVVANPFVPASGGTGLDGPADNTGRPEAAPQPRYRSGVPTILFVGTPLR